MNLFYATDEKTYFFIFIFIVLQYKKDEKPRARGKKDKPGFKNVTLPIELTEVHWLANGKPWGKSASTDLKYDMDGVLPGDDPVPPRKFDMGGVLEEDRKRKPDSDDDDSDDDAACAAAADAVESTAKRVKTETKLEDGDPE